MILKKIYRICIPSKFRYKIKNLKTQIKDYICLKNFKCRELIFKCGGTLNPSVKFLVITDSAHGIGLITGWMHYMTLVRYAFENGFVPIIDFKNYKMDFCQEDDVGKINTWNLYFTQPCPQYSLEDVYKSKYYCIVYYNDIMKKWGNILCKYSLYCSSNNDFPNLISKEDLILNRIYYSKCSFSSKIKERAVSIKENLFPKGEKVIGVSVRHMFSWYHLVKSEFVPDGTHPEKGSLNEIIDSIKKNLKKIGYNYIFLSVDERLAYNEIKTSFGDFCLTIPRMLPHPFDDDGAPIKYEKIGDENFKKMYVEFNGSPELYLRNNTTDYLTEVCLLSLCDSLACYGGSAGVFAYIMNPDYEYVL